jgi:uncharacterized protein (TIGR02217 family)
MAAFIEERFPEHVSRGTVGGPGWKTDISTRSSGFEDRNGPWSAPRYRYDARYGVRDLDDLHAVIQIFNVAGGRLRGFRFKDWSDFRSCPPLQSPDATDQPFGVGDGATTSFQLVKRYAFGASYFDRTIRKPVAGEILVAANGAPLPAGWSLNAATGLVTFDAAPSVGAVLTWGGEFDVPVRFDTDNLDLTLNTSRSSDIPSIPLMELRL